MIVQHFVADATRGDTRILLIVVIIVKTAIDDTLKLRLYTQLVQAQAKVSQYPVVVHCVKNASGVVPALVRGICTWIVHLFHF